MASRKDRKAIAEDTLARCAEIVASTQGASNSGIFVGSQLPPLDATNCPGYPETAIQVVNADSFATARDMARKATATGDNIQGKIAVLNLASDQYPGGGWDESLSKTQEEALCYSSTLFPTLSPEHYPWPNTGSGSVAGIYSPSVVVFKDDLDHDCIDLPSSEHLVVGVLTVAAPRYPPCTLGPNGAEIAKWSPRRTDPSVRISNAGVLEDLRGKIRLVYRMAAANGHTFLVLAAMGCGAYACPPTHVALEMKSILLEPEFKGWFKEVTFAVYSTPSNGGHNIAVFEKVFEGVVLNGETAQAVETRDDKKGFLSNLLSL